MSFKTLFFSSWSNTNATSVSQASMSIVYLPSSRGRADISWVISLSFNTSTALRSSTSCLNRKGSLFFNFFFSREVSLANFGPNSSKRYAHPKTTADLIRRSGTLAPWSPLWSSKSLEIFQGRPRTPSCQLPFLKKKHFSNLIVMAASHHKHNTSSICWRCCPGFS